jgi:hypothetical protein
MAFAETTGAAAAVALPVNTAWLNPLAAVLGQPCAAGYAGKKLIAETHQLTARLKAAEVEEVARLVPNTQQRDLS